MIRLRFWCFSREYSRRDAPYITKPFHGHKDCLITGEPKLDHLTQALGFSSVSLFSLVTNTYSVGRHFETTTSCFSWYFPLYLNFSNREWGLPTVITVEFAWWSFSISIIPSTFINWISPGRNRARLFFSIHWFIQLLILFMGYNPFHYYFIVLIC